MRKYTTDLYTDDIVQQSIFSRIAKDTVSDEVQTETYLIM